MENHGNELLKYRDHFGWMKTTENFCYSSNVVIRCAKVHLKPLNILVKIYQQRDVWFLLQMDYITVKVEIDMIRT